MKQLIYLGCPYSDPNTAICDRRFHEVNRIAGQMMKEGLFVFSPISHTHSICQDAEIPHGWNYWKEYDKCILSCCAMLVVTEMPNWHMSVGLKGEIEIAEELGLPILHINPNKVDVGIADIKLILIRIKEENE